MNDINLLSEYLENKKNKKKKRGALLLTIIIIFSTSIGFFIFNQRKIERLESELELLRIEMDSENIKEELNQYKNIEEKTKILTVYHDNLMEVINRIDKIYNVNSFMINDIKNVMPEKMFINSMNGSSDGVFIQGVTINRVLVAELQRNLKNLNHFKDVHVNVISAEHLESENLIFTVKCYFEDVTKDEAK